MYLYLWAHVLFGSLYIFPLKIFVARDQLHGQPEVDQLEFPRHQEKVTGLDVGMNDVDMVNLSKQTSAFMQEEICSHLTASNICSQ